MLFISPLLFVLPVYIVFVQTQIILEVTRPTVHSHDATPLKAIVHDHHHAHHHITTTTTQKPGRAVQHSGDHDHGERGVVIPKSNVHTHNPTKSEARNLIPHVHEATGESDEIKHSHDHDHGEHKHARLEVEREGHPENEHPVPHYRLPTVCPPATVINTCENRSVCEANLDILNSKYNMLEARYLAIKAMNDAMNRDLSTCSQQSSTAESFKPNLSSSINQTYLADCSELYKSGVRSSGIQTILPEGAQTSFPVFCEMLYDGWTLIMRRYDGSVNFTRNWEDYKHGFGNLSSEHWLGNENIHLLTSQPNKKYKLRVEMTFWITGLSYYAEYELFNVGNESTGYRLRVTGYSGNVDYDGLTHHSGYKFSTYDKDNDSLPRSNCAAQFGGGWWYTYCHLVNPTGLYKLICNHQCMEWKHEPLKKIIFKIKPS